MRNHDFFAHQLLETLSLTIKIIMLHIQFHACLASPVLLASCLPAVEPAVNASACQSSWYAWWSSSEAWGLETSTVTLLSSTLTPAFDFEVSYTTLCDGVRRAAISRTTTQTVTYDPPFTATLYRLYSSPKPSCVPYIPCNTYCAIHESAAKVYYWSVTTIIAPHYHAQYLMGYNDCIPYYC
jgi:hypothetical protein